MAKAKKRAKRLPPIPRGLKPPFRVERFGDITEWATIVDASGRWFHAPDKAFLKEHLGVAAIPLARAIAAGLNLLAEHLAKENENV